MRWIAAIIPLGLCLLGAAPAGPHVALLTGVEACYAGGEQGMAAMLLPDPEYGTRFNDQPVMWPIGYSGRRLASGDVEVVDALGGFVAVTGRRYFLSYGPVFSAERDQLRRAINAFPTQARSCGYPWDFKALD